MRKTRNAIPPPPVTNEALATEVEQLGSELIVLRRLLAEMQAKLNELFVWRAEHERRCLKNCTRRAAAERSSQSSLFS